MLYIQKHHVQLVKNVSVVTVFYKDAILNQRYGTLIFHQRDFFGVRSLRSESIAEFMLDSLVLDLLNIQKHLRLTTVALEGLGLL